MRGLPDHVVDTAFDLFFRCIQTGLKNSWQKTSRVLRVGGEDWFFPHFHSIAAIFPARHVERLWQWLWSSDQDEARYERLWFTLALSSAGFVHPYGYGIRVVDTRWLSEHHVAVTSDNHPFWDAETPRRLRSVVSEDTIARILDDPASFANVERDDQSGLPALPEDYGLDFRGELIAQRYPKYLDALSTDQSGWRAWQECPGLS